VFLFAIAWPFPKKIRLSLWIKINVTFAESALKFALPGLSKLRGGGGAWKKS